jgi:hypothetical protein
MLQIRRFVMRNQSDDAGPQPRWRIKLSAMAALERPAPLNAGFDIHLTPVGNTDNRGEIARRLSGLLDGELIDVQFQVLWQQFP